MNEEMICFLEESIPEIADAAVTRAYWHALASGGSVLERRDGNLVEIFPDGRRQVVRKLQPTMDVTIGQKVEIL
ncbi:MAG: hypothetical protein WC222_11880 [Parachlamydiales bacterium]